MNIYKEQIEGREFDWFAIDCKGYIGLFATAGMGSIPEVVIENYMQHDDIAQSIDSPNWGSDKVWLDYATLGFYVYDWDLLHGPYKKACEPAVNMGSELKAKLMAIENIPRLSIRFKDLDEIADIHLSN